MAIALVPALGLTVYRAVEDRRDATVQAQADALAVAEDASRTPAQLIDEGHQLLFGLAQLPTDGFGVLEQMLEIRRPARFRCCPDRQELSDDERRLLRSRAFSMLEKAQSSLAELRRQVRDAVARASGEQTLDSA